MSGICGIKNFKFEKPIDREILQGMCKVMIHNEFDERGLLVEKNIGLGQEVIHNEDNTIWVIGDGSIYNFLDLKDSLEKNGHRFYTDMDLEVIVHLYEKIGEACVEKLHGGFSFALWDKTKDIIFLARDQLGIKSLYFTYTEINFAFASEIKPMLVYLDGSAKIDFDSLYEYLTFQYVPGPKTIFEKVEKLLPGHLLIYKNGKMLIKKYWDFSYQMIHQNEKEICREIIKKLKESIRYNSIGDASKGVLLSGGIDSSTIVALMNEIDQRNIKTFSAVFRNSGFDESKHSQLIARHFATQHYQVLIEPQQALESLPQLIESLDEPIADASIIPTYLVTRFAKQNADICLTGDGGDELFGGYSTHQAYQLAKYYRNLPTSAKDMIKKLVNLLPTSNTRRLGFRVKKFITGVDYPAEVAYYIWWGAYTPDEKRKLLTRERRDYLQSHNSFRAVEFYLNKCDCTDPLDRIFYMDLKFNLPDGSLRKMETMGRLNSLELRYPFLDPSLVKFAATIPSFLKLKGLTTKYIFRKAIRPYLPPMISKVSKRGFDLPLGDWMCKEFKSFIIETLSKSEIEKQGFFDYFYIKKVLDEHFNRRQNNRQKIWPLVIFTLWYKSNFEGRTYS